MKNPHPLNKYTQNVNIPSSGVSFADTGAGYMFREITDGKITSTPLDQQVSADNPVRLIDAFIDKLDLKKLGFSLIADKDEGRRS